MTSENTVMRQVWAALGGTSRLFRVNTGTAWVGSGKPERLADGTVALRGGRPVTLGFGYADGKPVVGTPDLCGWTPVKITSEMVGKTLPVFTGIETKASNGGHKREGQINFVAQLQQSGGIAGFAASARQAVDIVEAWKSGRTPDPM